MSVANGIDYGERIETLEGRVDLVEDKVEWQAEKVIKPIEVLAKSIEGRIEHFENVAKAVASKTAAINEDRRKDAVLVGQLHADVRKLLDAPPPLPVMRDPEISSHQIEPLASAVVQAVKDGERRPDSNPTAEVRKIFAEEASKRERDKKIARLEAEEVEREKAASDAKRTRIKIRNSVIGTVLGAAALRALEWALTNSHHLF